MRGEGGNFEEMLDEGINLKVSFYDPTLPGASAGNGIDPPPPGALRELPLVLFLPSPPQEQTPALKRTHSPT